MERADDFEGVTFLWNRDDDPLADDRGIFGVIHLEDLPAARVDVKRPERHSVKESPNLV